ncbi:MAG: hypothetical protein WAK25_17625, partial [Acidobacteriaceae bacterium]
PTATLPANMNCFQLREEPCSVTPAVKEQPLREFVFFDGQGSIETNRMRRFEMFDPEKLQQPLRQFWKKHGTLQLPRNIDPPLLRSLRVTTLQPITQRFIHARLPTPTLGTEMLHDVL